MPRCPWRRFTTFIGKCAIAIRAVAEQCKSKIDDLIKGIARMGEKFDAAAADLRADIQAVVDGWAAKDAVIADLRARAERAEAALASADADKAAAVAAQADSDDTDHAAAIADADAALERLLPAPVEEPAPVDEVPADEAPASE